MSVSFRAPILAWILVALVAAWGCGDVVPTDAPEERPAGTPPATSDVRPPSAEWEPIAGVSGADPAGALFDSVAARAMRLASGPWVPPDTGLSAPAGALTYGQYRGIRFRDEASLWGDGGAYRLHLFHPGGGFRVPVAVTLVEGDTFREVTFDPTRFRYGDEVEGMDLGLPPEAGHAGFRLLHPLNDAGRFDEVVSFLGASYFRLLGPGHVYGLSARGLAVGVAAPEGEEFPDFTRFWVLRPHETLEEAPADAPVDRGIVDTTAGDASGGRAGAPVTVVALLEGPSITGAYRFVLRPGRPAAPGGETDAVPTTVDADVRLFARRDVPRLGVAPLTSMYLHGTFRRGGEDDVRPRVHDSQGLLMLTADGEWIWRPLTNRAGVSMTTLRDVEPRGFGLVQRDRDFGSYLDLEAQYHRRPSLWVEAGEGDWGGGGVALVELPSPSEFNDNIVAYWAPDGGMAAGESRAFSYRLVTFDAHLPQESLLWVKRTRVGWDALPGQVDPPPRSRRRIVVDFALPGGGSASAGGGAPLPEAALQLSRGQADDLRVQALPDGGVRVTFALVPDEGAPADMRLQLLRDGSVVSETWSWLWRAEDGV